MPETDKLYPRTYHNRRSWKVLFTVFGSLTMAAGFSLFWILYTTNIEDHEPRRASPAGVAFLMFIIIAGIAIAAFMVVSGSGESELVLYDDAIEQRWRFGARRLLKADIAYKLPISYKVPSVVLVPRDKRRKKITLVPSTFVRDDAFDAWMNSIPSRQDWLAARHAN